MELKSLYSFYVWLLSLTIGVFQNHPCYIYQQLFSFLLLSALHCIVGTEFVYPSLVDGYLGCSEFVAIMNKAPTNICMQVSVDNVFSFLEQILRSGIARLCGKFIPYQTLPNFSIAVLLFCSSHCGVCEFKLFYILGSRCGQSFLF